MFTGGVENMCGQTDGIAGSSGPSQRRADTAGGTRVRKGVGHAAPADFDEVFVSIGRLACEEHYGVGRLRIAAWLKERGETRLIAARGQRAGKYSRHGNAEFRDKSRARFIAALKEGDSVETAATVSGVSKQTLYDWRKDDREFADAWDQAKDSGRLTRNDVARILARAYPIDGDRLLAANAAQYLRHARNGGWLVSPAEHGLWWLGNRKVTVQELVEKARKKGFKR